MTLSKQYTRGRMRARTSVMRCFLSGFKNLPPTISVIPFHLTVSSHLPDYFKETAHRQSSENWVESILLKEIFAFINKISICSLSPPFQLGREDDSKNVWLMKNIVINLHNNFTLVYCVFFRSPAILASSFTLSLNIFFNL